MSTKAEALEAIYGRLASAPTFHPANADLFTDWTVQGGDILTVHTNNVPHFVPVYSMQMKWTGKPKVTVQSTGDEEMPSIETLAQQKSSTRGSSYRRGIAAAESDQEIHQAIFSEDGYMHTYIDVTASGIRTEVGTAISNMAQSVIEQTATYIRTEVANAASSISATVIEQTSDYVRTEVASVASGVAWTVVTQTMTGIEQRVAQRSRVFVQWEDPSTVHDDLVDGDLWYKKPNSTTWNALSGSKWNDISEHQWKDLYGIVHYVWKNGAWQKVSDTATILENDTYIEHDREHWAVYSRQLDLQGETFNANLNVTAHKISTEVSATKAGLLSTIAQTATNINLHVEDVKNGLQSNIEQTASSITMTVEAKEAGLYSTIEQTATQIRVEVANAQSGLHSEIQVQANRIGLVVGGTDENPYIKPASIVAAINDGESSVVISADHIDLDGYVKASDLTTTWLSTKIAAISNLSVNNVTATSVKVLVGQNLSDVATQTYVSGCPYDLRITSSGNTYKLQWKRLGYSAEWADVGSFSRAISSWVTGGGSGKVNVTALPQNQTKSVNVSIDGNSSITSNGTYTYTVDYENEDGDDVSTGATKTVTVNVPSGSHSISITPDNVGHSDEPTGTRLWSTTTFQKNKWYKFTVNCGTAQKVYKILINTP